MTNQSNFDYKISFRIVHPTIDPNEITKKIGILPSMVQLAGEKRFSPSGRELPGTYKFSSWNHHIATVKAGGVTAVSKIREFNNKLSEQQHFFQEICDSGGRIEYFIGWFSGLNSGEVFDWEILRDCANLRISIVLDVYSERRP